jgi:hypothetical protein
MQPSFSPESIERATLDQLYDRRRYDDPLDIVSKNPSRHPESGKFSTQIFDVQMQRVQDDREAGESIDPDRLTKVLEFGMDSLYYDKTQSEEDKQTLANGLLQEYVLLRSASVLEGTDEIDPGRVVQWFTAATKITDLRSFLLLGQAKAAEQVVDGGARTNARQLVDATERDIIDSMSQDMLKVISVHDSLDRHVREDEEVRKKLRGMLFEQLTLGHERYKLFESEELDTAWARTSLDFEDRPARGFAPLHSFDIVVTKEVAEATDTRVIQCKNSNNGPLYDQRIEMIIGRAFYRFMDDPETFTKMLGELVKNDQMTSNEDMEADRRRLDALFTIEPAIQNLGSTGLK